ncbi:MAG TPA: WecB/TagA/CpsF family glycosyltransferase, partial [Roseiflexaceae bacterium]|nr:WecB/TagA/CpsF family glycosyltransferase [Roseiflexaceae bacterium]
LLAQAPERLQRLGLEWLYRLTREPKRLWRRYVLLNPSYLALLTLQASGLKRFDLANGTPPTREIGYG